MPTTNPVPSTDPSDLLFNAGKLDEVVNGASNSFTDRLGATRRTVAGMNADFDAQLADAESDLNVYRADAAASAADALGYLQTIRATSYGAYAEDPATDPLGNPPTVGDEYFNTTSNLLKRWNGTTWQASDINTANLAAPSGSSLVGHTQAVTGAVATTVEKKLQDRLSLFDFMTPNQISGVMAGSAVDLTAPVQVAANSGKAIYIPDFVFLVDQVIGSNAHFFGPGKFKKKPGTKGSMFSLSGENKVRDVGFDYDWQNSDQSLPYWPNTCITLSGGSLDVLGAKFSRTFADAILNFGGSLNVGFSKFSGGAPHNGLSGGNERVTGYINCKAPTVAGEQNIKISDNVFEGASADPSLRHLNPCAIFVTASTLDGVRFKHVNITDNVIVACGQNAGAGNVTGAIDTYNGVENLVITGNNIRYFSYAGIKVQNSSNFTITGNTILDGVSPVGSSVDQSLGILTNQKVRGATANQYNGTITGNTIKGTKYYAIGNGVDNVVIIGNTIDGVEKSILGNAIQNTGSNVTIDDNTCTNIGGDFIQSSGDSVKILSNTLKSSGVSGGSGILFSGSDVKIKDNTIKSAAGSVYSGIRTDGNASTVLIDGNTVDGFNNGTDIRTTGGAVDGLDIGINAYKNIGNVNENIVSGVTNVSRARKNLPQVQVIYDPPSLAVGTCGPVQTLTLAGAELGDEVYGTGARNMLGLYVMAWVSVSGTVSWAVCNPPGNPNGTQDFPNTVFKFRVVKQQQ